MQQLTYRMKYHDYDAEVKNVNKEWEARWAENQSILLRFVSVIYNNQSFC